MSDRRLAQAVRQIRRFAQPPANPADDRTLLAAFAKSRDEAAFAELVRRHGSLVLGVCRRVLGDVHSADDVFQATFLTLARKAGSVRWRASVGPWLYAVAYRLARKAQSRASRERQRPEFFHRQPAVAGVPACGSPASSPDPAVAAAWAELRQILDDELAQLPDRLRSPLVLCYLDGRTRDEAAAALGWTLATLKRRLERGRALLRQRLESRGVTEGLLAAAVEVVPVASDLRAATATAAIAYAIDGTVIGPVAALMGSGSNIGARAALVGATLFSGAVALLASGVALTPRGPTQPLERPNLGALTQPRSPRNGADAPAMMANSDPLPAGAVARIGTLNFCHGFPVQQLLTSADGKSIITIGGPVRIWDAASGSQEGVIPATKGQFYMSGSLLPGGDQLALSCFDGTIHIWDWKTRGEVRSFKPELSGGRAIAQGSYVFDPTGRLAVLTNHNGSAPLVDVATGKVTHELPCKPNYALTPTFTADGKTVISAESGEPLRVWDVATGKQLRQIASPTFNVNALTVSPDGRWLAVAGFSVRTMRAPGGGTISISEADKIVNVVDLTTGRDVHQLDSGAAGTGTQNPTLLFTPDSRFLLTGANGMNGQYVRQWDMATGKQVREFATIGSGALGAGGPALALSRDGQTLLIADTVVRLWDWQTGKEKQHVTENPGRVSALAFLPDGRSLIAAGEAFAMWDSGTGRQQRRLTGDEPQGVTIRKVDGIALAPDGRTIAVVSHAGDPRQLAVIDTATGRRIREAKAGDGYLFGPTISPDGKSLATATVGDNTVRVWDSATLAERRAVKLPTSGGIMAFSTDGRMLRGIMEAMLGKKVLFSIDTPTGELTKRGALDTANQLSAFAWSPDGRVLAAAGWRGNLSGLMSETDQAGIYAFDAVTAEQSREFNGVKFVPSQIAFSRDGKQLAAGDWNGTVTTWDVATGKQVREFAGHRGQVTSLAFSADGKRLASGSIDTTVLIWDMSEVRPADK
jgi:RNA polymerase sigma factor (sigma-70 family)